MHGRWAAPLLVIPSLAFAEVSEEQLLSMPLEDLGKLEVNIATGTPKALSEAPAVASVITATDIEATGAQTLDEALAGVPGLHVSESAIAYSSRYFIRGIYSTYNPETLILVNGVPTTSMWLGDRLPGWQGVPASMIERIEIVRGPGSAVYGADAFAGVINIITKGFSDLNQNLASVSHGSADTTRAELQQRGQLGALRSAFFLSYDQTAGDKGVIRADAQSAIDAMHFSPPASLAPSSVNRGFDDANARLQLDYNDWRLRAAWEENWHVGTGQGIAESLDPVGRFSERWGDVDLGWHKANLPHDWEVNGQLAYSYKAFTNVVPSVNYPPGAFFGSFPQGVLDAPSLAEQEVHMEGSAVYQGWHDHRLRLGAGYFKGDIYKVVDIKNYDASHPPLIMPLPTGMTNVSGTPAAFQPTGHRAETFGLVQDEWALGRLWQLTAGVRYDHYSDFGGTTNPRAALVWETTASLTTKLLYGTAFRAPSFSELAVTNNPLLNGNPALKPERIKSQELAFAYHPPTAWSLDFNVYQFRIRDFIEYVAVPNEVASTAENVGNYIGEGMETEGRWQVRRTLQLLLNYSHQHTYSVSSGAPLGPAPRDQAYARMIWDIRNNWQFTPQLTWVGSRPRSAGDPRDALHGYMTLDLTLRRRLPHGVEVSLVGRNFANADIREPTNPPNSAQTQANIPFDLPEPGRALTVEISARW